MIEQEPRTMQVLYLDYLQSTWPSLILWSRNLWFREGQWHVWSHKAFNPDLPRLQSPNYFLYSFFPEVYSMGRPLVSQKGWRSPNYFLYSFFPEVYSMGRPLVSQKGWRQGMLVNRYFGKHWVKTTTFKTSWRFNNLFFLISERGNWCAYT